MATGNGRSDSRVGEGGRLKGGGTNARWVKCSLPMTDAMPKRRLVAFT